MSDQNLALIANVISLCIGFIIVWWLTGKVEGFLDRKTNHIGEDEDSEQRWEKHGPAGLTIGRMECCLYFIAIVVGYPLAIGGWLALKVAAKWDAWGHVIRLPELDKFQDFKDPSVVLRLKFSSWILSRFLIGTLATLLIAIGAAAVFVGVRILIGEYFEIPRHELILDCGVLTRCDAN